MHVVAAGMHHPCDLRGIGNFICLLDRQGIHVRPEGNPGTFVAQITYNTCFAHATARIDAQFIESFGHFLGSSMLLERKLGMAMDVSARFHQYGTQFLSSFKH
jgi:hypothetical protein